MTQWTANNIPDQSGKTALVTGANTGLGYASSVELARHGAQVVMAARNTEKGERAKADLLAAVPNADVDLMQLDLGNLASVRAFTDAFKAKYDRLDILMNNAGVMAIPRRETADGFETQFGVNHLGHFALTARLFDLIQATPAARIVNLSSSAAFGGSMKFDDLQGERSYNRWQAYGQSKLSNLLFTFELDRRLKAVNASAISNAAHPGIVYTNLQKNSVESSGGNMEEFLYTLIKPIAMQPVEMGILPQLYAATALDAVGAVFYGPSIFNIRGYPKATNPPRNAQDTAAAERLWSVSEELTGETFTIA